ncbi:unnamed protein product [Linum tenue]|uniref:peroxidase n=2 Tax=Linum tenue TaxID=586396 RepID=A0AAV0N0P8_9ROSI|nr:unnamed protein product [Linum tenue]
MTVLSGGHTIGQARCDGFRNRIYNKTNFATTRRGSCPASGGDGNLAPLDSSPNRFDNAYFSALVGGNSFFRSSSPGKRF